MPEKATLRRAQQDKREGKSASTQAGEFVREEIHHVREGKHGARSAKQAIAIGLSKARRAGVDLPAAPGEEGKPASKRKASKRKASKRKSISSKPAVSKQRSRAAKAALEHEGHAAGSSIALSRHATAAARAHTPAERSASAKKAARTKGSAGRKAAARKAARTRASHHEAESKAESKAG